MPVALVVLCGLVGALREGGWKTESKARVLAGRTEAPLAEPASRYALFFIYDYLSTRADDAAAQLAAHWRREARLALPRVRLSLAGEATTPFVPRIQRS